LPLRSFVSANARAGRAAATHSRKHSARRVRALSRQQRSAFYHLDIRVDPLKKSITGKNTIRFKMLKDDTRIQLDLYENLKIDEIVFEPGRNVLSPRLGDPPRSWRIRRS